MFIGASLLYQQSAGRCVRESAAEFFTGNNPPLPDTETPATAPGD
jgi:hypothetical protein